MPESFLHDHKEFRDIINATAAEQRINDPALVEKDYWIMHTLYGLKAVGLTFALKGGTSLSKGFGVINRFSEDIDIWIKPFDDTKVSETAASKAAIESRRNFFEKLQATISIPGIVTVQRDTSYDDAKLRNAGMRLIYNSHYGAIEGLKEGVLLEVGFDTISPNTPRDISSWAWDFARERKIESVDNRAIGVTCYNPEYTFVEKLQTVVRKFRQYQESGALPRNFLRHYYDIHQLLGLDSVQAFIGTAEYLKHKRVRFRKENHNLTETDAFTLKEPKTRKLFETEYAKTAALYYRGQISLGEIIRKIAVDLRRL